MNLVLLIASYGRINCIFLEVLDFVGWGIFCFVVKLRVGCLSIGELFLVGGCLFIICRGRVEDLIFIC